MFPCNVIRATTKISYHQLNENDYGRDEAWNLRECLKK
jgi:hypothetical protein